MSSEELLRVLGQRIRKLREHRGWSQEELAQRCGRHFTYIGRVERGRQNITVEVLLEISEALSVSIADLFTTEDHPLLLKWKVSANDIIEAVSQGFRAQVDVKGKLAEWMLFKELKRFRENGIVNEIEWLDEDGKPDFIVDVGKRKVVVECKNVRSPDTKRKSPEPIRVELQRTRNAMDGSNTRGYSTDHFDVLSVCLFNRTGNWDFIHISMKNLLTRPNNPGFLKVMQNVSPESEYPWRATFIEAVRDSEE
jgi:transcriptional regulator with XRE-family HTH domain